MTNRKHVIIRKLIEYLKEKRAEGWTIIDPKQKEGK